VEVPEVPRAAAAEVEVAAVGAAVVGVAAAATVLPPAAESSSAAELSSAPWTSPDGTSGAMVRLVEADWPLPSKSAPADEAADWPCTVPLLWASWPLWSVQSI
jgi:hypothetical protein